MKRPAISGVNHLTIAVSNLDRSLAFYCDLLGLRRRAVWDDGAYLEAGSLWLCLSLDSSAKKPPPTDYTHIAFDVDEAAFNQLSELVCREAIIWKDNKSEGNSLYFLDPDGHKLELHVGSLSTRLAHYRKNPFPNLRLYED